MRGGDGRRRGWPPRCRPSSSMAAETPGSRSSAACAATAPHGTEGLEQSLSATHRDLATAVIANYRDAVVRRSGKRSGAPRRAAWRGPSRRHPTTAPEGRAAVLRGTSAPHQRRGQQGSEARSPRSGSSPRRSRRSAKPRSCGPAGPIPFSVWRARSSMVSRTSIAAPMP